jgi:hypothetical protein
MSSTFDVWYIRFPDGRVVRAPSTATVRAQLGAGRIPPECAVRRGPDDEWVALGGASEFADLVGARLANGSPDVAVAPGRRAGAAPPEPGGIAARLDPARLQTVGVRGLVEELLAALDSTLVRRKLTVALVGALGVGLVLGLTPVRLAAFGLTGTEVAWLVTCGLLVLFAALTAALLTRMTYVELSRLRPARWREAFAGAAGLTLQVAVAQVLVLGTTLLLIVALRLLPTWFLGSGPGGEAWSSDVGANTTLVLSMFAEVALWPIFGLALLLPGLLAVENCSAASALVQWLRLLQRDLGRAFLYEALAVGVGLVATLPLLFPLLPFAGTSFEHFDPRLGPAVVVTKTVLTCLAFAPLFAYLVVANLFIYLNLRYEMAHPRA